MGDDHLTILSEYFHPESSATSQLLTQLATNISDQFSVECITSFPNYHEDDRDVEVPQRDEYKDVKINRIRSTRFDKDNLPKRLVNWFTYTFATTVQLLRSSTDIVLVVSNPPTLPGAAWIRKRLCGTPYVYLIHDLYPDIAVELGLIDENHPIERTWRRVNSIFLSDSDKIIVLGESMRKEVLARYESVDDSQVVVIHNWEDESVIKPIPKSKNQFAREHGTIEPFTIVYSGNIGRFHELKTVINAVDHLSEEGYDVKFLIIGEGAQKKELRDYTTTNDIDPVEFLPFQPTDQLPKSLTCGDVSLVGIKEGMEGLCVSSKLYSALASGRPILAVVGNGDEVESVVREHDCGIHVEPGETEDCIEAIKRWIEDPQIRNEHGENARRCLEQRFTFEEAQQRYRSVLDGVLSERE